MSGNRQIYPKQRVSFSKKIANNYQWWKDSMDAQLYSYLDYGTFPSYSGLTHLGDNEYDRMVSNYQLFNNFLNQKDFERECNPMGLTVGQFQDEVKPYNKSYNKINVILGEHLKRPIDARVAIMSEDGISRKLQEIDSQVQLMMFDAMSEIQQMYMESASQMFSQEGIEDPEQQQALNEQVMKFVESFVSPQKLSGYVGEGFISKLEKAYSRLLRYFKYTKRLKEKMNDSFKHGLISGYEFAWVGIRNGEPVVEVLNPLGMMFVKSPETKFIQNGSSAGYRTVMTTSDIFSEYGDYMKVSDIERIEDYHHGYSGARYNEVGEYMRYPSDDMAYRYNKANAGRTIYEGSYGRSETLADDWIVYHLEWVSQRKIYFETRINEYGDEELNMLSEDFVIPPYAEKENVTLSSGKRKTFWRFDGSTVEEAWIPEVLTGTRIGDDIFVQMQPKELQFRNIDNPYKVKLGYHGVAYSNMNAPNISLMDRMKPFQYLYLIAMHKLKELIAKDKGRLFHFDITMVDPKIGIEKTMYYLNHLDLDIFNPLQNAETAGAAQRGKITTATDRSNMQHISHYIALLESLDQQISDVAGVTKQREGQSSPHEAVSNHQQNIVQSTHITEPLFHLNAVHWQEIMNSLVKAGAHLWKDTGVTRQYVLDDMSIEVLNIEAGLLGQSEVAVFITNTPKENEVFQKIQALAEPLIRSDKAKMKDIIKLFNADSVNEAAQAINKSEKEREEREDAMQKLQQEMQQQQLQSQAQEEEKKRQHEITIEELKIRGQLAVEQLKLQAQAAVSETDVPDTLPELNNVETNSSDRTLEEQKMRSEERMHAEKMKIEEKKAAQKPAKPSS